MGTMPADACPFSRPFQEGFNECPTYDGVQFHPATLANKPLSPAWTCSHLTIGSSLEGYPRKYGQCALGDSTARLQWLKERIAGRERAISDNTEPALGLT